MYSVVVMMALSGTPAVPDFGRCNGCYGCYGCYGGCYGCYGGWGCHGCYGGWGWGCYGCWGGCYGCWGGSPYGVMWGAPCYGCGGRPAAPSQAPAPKTTQAENRATILVQLPEDARLTLDGQVMKTGSALRRFVTPPLERGWKYQYVVRAEVVRDGQKLVNAQKITVRAGEETKLTLDFSAAGLAYNP
jgi:uncharacterized protein (TIGR03000 family)